MFSTAEIMDSYVKTLEHKASLRYRPPAWSRQFNGISMLGVVHSENENNNLVFAKNDEMENPNRKEN